MVKQNSSLWERLKACWDVLTKDNYVVFCVNDAVLEWKKDGIYSRIKPKSISCYSKVTYNVKWNTKKGITNLHDFFWSCIEDFSKEAQQGKY